MDINERSRQTKGYKPFMVFYNIAMGLFYIAGGVFFYCTAQRIAYFKSDFIRFVRLGHVIVRRGLGFTGGYSEYRQKKMKIN
jgi:hypothetical protein